jgi:hypothetical protein
MRSLDPDPEVLFPSHPIAFPTHDALMLHTPNEINADIVLEVEYRPAFSPSTRWA